MLPENPEFAEVVDGYSLVVQSCLSPRPMPPLFGNFVEEVVPLWGKTAIQYRGLGLLHPYDSHFSYIAGLRAPFKPDGGWVEVVVGALSPNAHAVARRILMSMHPAPGNVGMPLSTASDREGC